MINVVHESKSEAIEIAIKIGLIKKAEKSNDTTCFCPISPHIKTKSERINENNFSNCIEFEDEKIEELQLKLILAPLKNYANKFDENTITEISLYVEVYRNNHRYVFKKTSMCWLLSEEGYKCSSDRKYRVRDTSKLYKKKKNVLKSAPAKRKKQCS